MEQNGAQMAAPATAALEGLAASSCNTITTMALLVRSFEVHLVAQLQP
jgi:hypothetical protein